MKLQQENNILLELSKEIFLEVDQEKLSIIIMSHLKRLVRADRCALFIADYETMELWSAVFSEDDKEGKEEKTTSGSEEIQKKPTVIRIPMDRGVAGYVCQSGELVNIADAYEDARFNKKWIRKLDM